MRRPGWLLLLALAAASAAGAEEGEGAPVEGLLLGVRTRYDFDHPQPTTLFVTDRGLRVLEEGLVLPRKGGGHWWIGAVQQQRLTSGDTPTLEQRARLVAVPSGQKPARDRWVQPPESGEAEAEEADAGAVAQPPHACDDDSGDALLFAGGDLVSFQSRRVSYCGGADPDTLGDVVTWRLGGKQPQRVTAGQALGAALEKKLLAAGTADAESRVRLGDPDPKMWGLRHEQGVWILEGGRPRSTGSNGPSFGDFTLAAPLPRRLAGENALRKPWAEYRKLDPAAGDVLDSPSGRLTVLFDRDAIRLFVGGKEAQRLPFKDPQVVQAQWSIGQGAVARAEREATAALAPPKASAAK